MFVAVLPLAGCAALSTESIAVTEPIGYFSQSGEAPLQSHWWKSLPDAQPQVLEQTALVANPDLLATQARLAEAAALARKNGALPWPQIEAGVLDHCEFKGQGIGVEPRIRILAGSTL